MTKKLLLIFLAISISLSITACGGEKNSDSSTAEVTTTTSETAITTEAEEVTSSMPIAQTISIAGKEYDINSKEITIFLNDNRTMLFDRSNYVYR